MSSDISVATTGPAAGSGQSPLCSSGFIRSLNHMSLFWCLIVFGTLGFGIIDAVQPDPSLRASPRAEIMGALTVAYLAWFAYLMSRRKHYGRPTDWRLHSVVRRYALIGIGMALAAALLALSPSFIGLVYVQIGIGATAFELRESALLIVAAVALYAYGQHRLTPDITPLGVAENSFSLFLTLGIAYSIAALIRQRFEREHLIEELQEAQRRLRISAAQEADLAALRERHRLAREMHDSLGHALVSIAVKIEAAQRLHAVDPPRAEAEWEETKALVRSAMGELRSSLAGMRLPALEEQPFAEALAALASDMGRNAGVDTTVEVSSDAAAIERPAQEALYRVAQEALANVAKHAHAAHAWLRLSTSGQAATLEVRDDGVGLGAGSRGGGHYGVMGMRERVEALGGVLTIGPAPDRGTVVRSIIPLRDSSVLDAVGLRNVRVYAEAPDRTDMAEPIVAGP